LREHPEAADTVTIDWYTPRPSEGARSGS
jgi:hypothetical protein